MMYRLRQLLALAREYLFVTVCLIVILVAGNLSLYINLDNTELEHKQTRLRTEGDAMNRTLNASITLHSDAQVIDSALKEIDASLVAEDNLADNKGYFYVIEDQTQAQITILSQNSSLPGEADQKFKTVPVTLSVKGTYPKVFDFLYRVETGSRLMKISSFTMHRSQPTGDAVTLTLELHMLASP